MQNKQAVWEKNIMKTYNVKELAWTNEPPHNDTDRRNLLQKFWTPVFIFKFSRGRAASNQSNSPTAFVIQLQGRISSPYVEFAAISLPHVQSNRLYLNKPITSSTNGKLVEDTQGSGVINCRTPNCSNYRSIAKLSEEEVQRVRSGNERTRKRRKSAEIDAIGSNKDEFIRRGSWAEATRGADAIVSRSVGMVLHASRSFGLLHPEQASSF